MSFRKSSRGGAFHHSSSIIIEEIRTLSVYLNFGHKNLTEFKQRLATELNQNIEKIRQTEVVDPEVSDYELVQRVLAMDFVEEEFFYTESGRPFLNINSNFFETEYSQEFDKMFYITIVTMLYSCIERGLIKLCDIKKEGNGKRKKVLDSARLFFKAATDYKFDESIWQEIDNLRRLRNILMHSGLSLLNDSFDIEVLIDNYGDKTFVENYQADHIETHPKFIEYLKSKNIYGKERGVINLNLEYCESVIEISHRFFAGFLYIHDGYSAKLSVKKAPKG
jgi:hypothetical protein